MRGGGGSLGWAVGCEGEVGEWGWKNYNLSGEKTGKSIYF